MKFHEVKQCSMKFYDIKTSNEDEAEIAKEVFYTIISFYFIHAL